MNIETIRQLASTPPPKNKWRYKDHRSASEAINRQELALGLSPGPRCLSLGLANARAAELEAMVQKLAVEKLPAAIETKIPDGILSTAAQFLAMPVAEQAAFAEQQKQLSVTAYNDLPSTTLKARFLDLGGKITATSGDEITRIKSKDPIRANSKLMRLQIFNQLGQASRLALIRNGLILSA